MKQASVVRREPEQIRNGVKIFIHSKEGMHPKQAPARTLAAGLLIATEREA